MWCKEKNGQQLGSKKKRNWVKLKKIGYLRCKPKKHNISKIGYINMIPQNYIFIDRMY